MPGDAPLTGMRVVLGVTGGIAAYKSAILARLFVKDGADVHVILSESATHFIGDATFTGITGNRVRRTVWDEPEPSTGGHASDGDRDQIPHIGLARGADVVVVAPATANLLARAASGLADDLLTNVLLMARCPVVVAPAMHTEMWEHPATQTNAETLAARGIELVGPAEGELAGGDTGEGRMVEPDVIADRVRQVLVSSRDLVGVHAVVTAGPTREYLDPVRFLGNRSSGRMGFALAREAARRGADVDLVTGPVQLDTPAGVRRHDVVSALDMQDQVEKLASDSDVVVKAAAVGDFRPADPAGEKIKKDAGPPTVELARNPDILAELGRRRDDGRPVLVGFAAETSDAEARGREKLRNKKVDLIVVNDVSAADAGFEVSTNRVLILGTGDHRVEVPLTSKEQVARRVWDEIAALLVGTPET